MDSKILTDDEKGKLKELFVGNNCDIGAEWKLLYRGSEHSFSSDVWNKVCVNKKNVITIIHSDNECVFGGFTIEGWISPNSNMEPLAYNKDERAFIFRLRSSKNKAEIFAVKPKKADYAIVAEASHMSCFGDNGFDMAISHECDQNVKSWVGWTHAEFSYETPPDEHYLNDGQMRFKVHEVETFVNLK